MEQPLNDPTEHLVRLATPLSISQLINSEGTTFELNFEDLESQENEQLSYEPKDVFAHVKPDCCDLLVDEDTYQDGEPFERLMAKMQKVTEDGGIKKRILREGYGSVLPEKAVATIDYNAYVEYNDEPYDSTYVRKRPYTFRLGEGATIPGLDMAVQTMKMNEQSQFLIDPKYAYGALGCLARVPPNSTILFEIEVKNAVDSGATVSYPNLSEEKKQDFEEVYKYVHALIAKANDLFKKQLYKQAIREYNTAVAKLEQCSMGDYNEQERQQQLLLRLLANLVIAYTKIEEPRRACINCNKIYNMCRGTALRVPVKVYFNHARSLILLSDYEAAEHKLRQAQRLEPQNKEITNEFINLEAKKKESYDREVALAKAIFKNTEINKELHDTTEVTKEFEESLAQFCKDLKGDSRSTQYNLPDKLTKKELEFSKNEVQKYGLQFTCSNRNGVERYFIAKPTAPE